MHLDTDLFEYDAPSKTFSANIGDLARASGEDWSRLFPDYNDEGLFLKSTKTGNTVRYYIRRKNYDRDGRIANWVLWPVIADLKNNPGLAYSKIVIQNI